LDAGKFGLRLGGEGKKSKRKEQTCDLKFISMDGLGERFDGGGGGKEKTKVKQTPKQR